MEKIKQYYRRFRRWQQEEPHFVNRHEGEVQHCHRDTMIRAYLIILAAVTLLTAVAFYVTHLINKRTFRKNKSHTGGVV